MLQLGLMPSHLSFLLLQTTHARRFGLGTLEFPPLGPSAVPGLPFDWPSGLWSPTMMVSDAASDDGDMGWRGRAQYLLSGPWRRDVIAVALLVGAPLGVGSDTAPVCRGYFESSRRSRIQGRRSEKHGVAEGGSEPGYQLITMAVFGKGGQVGERPQKGNAQFSFQLPRSRSRMSS